MLCYIYAMPLQCYSSLCYAKLCYCVLCHAVLSCVVLCLFIVCTAVKLPPHRLLDGAVVLADVVDDAGDAERTGKAQQVGHESECDAEHERSSEGFPQSLPD